ncbi:hypothetical protein QFZ22_001349 [Streptomyces canus]|uniref:Uncharacterized protein n=1 Tax=Streptomyces canus TaxID=58343 RepID=A0AAW8F6F5_9ACTN|nr:hypothetical protein [Streptomyces canus]MDQ0905364.1 hypothetical protein [Streptomyces canus]
MTNELNRRGFVGTTAAVADAAAMARRLSARGTGEQQQTRTHAASGLRKALPVHVPRASVKPDMPSVSNGPDLATAPDFLRHPSDRPTTVSGAPGKGPQVHRGPPAGHRATAGELLLVPEDASVVVPCLAQSAEQQHSCPHHRAAGSVAG